VNVSVVVVGLTDRAGDDMNPSFDSGRDVAALAPVVSLRLVGKMSRLYTAAVQASRTACTGAFGNGFVVAEMANCVRSVVSVGELKHQSVNAAPVFVPAGLSVPTALNSPGPVKAPVRLALGFLRQEIFKCQAAPSLVLRLRRLLKGKAARTTETGVVLMAVLSGRSSGAVGTTSGNAWRIHMLTVPGVTTGSVV
jgi:hypothetical protein